MPFWRKGIRLGRVKATLRNLLDADAARRLSADAITGLIDARLSGADAEPPEKPLKLLRAANLTQGLLNILYHCVNCESEFTLETEGNTVRCRACGFAAEMDKSGVFTPLTAFEKNTPAAVLNVHSWFKLQTAREARAAENLDNAGQIRVAVSVRMAAGFGKGLVWCGRGVVSLDAKGWRYEGGLKGGEVSLFFPINTVPAVPFDPNDNFQIYSKGEIYLFTPEENPAACVKYAVLGEVAYKRFASPSEMTDGV
jgi:hypothetical protein